MKHTDLISKNGIIFHPVTEIITKALAKSDNPLDLTGSKQILVITNDSEIFDEALKTIRCRWQNAVGLGLEPNAGTVVPKDHTDIYIYNDHNGKRVTLNIMTKDYYETNKVDVDLVVVDEKVEIAFSGGRN